MKRLTVILSALGVLCGSFAAVAVPKPNFIVSPKKTDPNTAWPKDCMTWLRDIGVIEPGTPLP